MKPNPHEPLKSTEGMVDYDRNSAAQRQMVNLHGARIRELVGRLGAVEPELNIVDYGCGPGTSAVDTVKPAIEAYRERFPDVPIAVCHADQPGNDWNALFKLVYGPTGYRNGLDAVRSSAAVGTFYSQMVPQNSVDFGTCFAASHWLSHAVNIRAPGSVWFADLEGEARNELAALAREDWMTFLSCRAVELRRNGYLLVSTLGSVPDDSERNGAAASGRGIYRAMQVVAQAMADEGRIDSGALDNFVFALWFMTEHEAREPLETDPFLSEAFDIEEISVAPVSDNYADVFGALIGDPTEYAKRYRGYIRAFADTTLRKQLFEPSAANASDADRLADEFFDRLEELYRVHTNKYAFELWHLSVILKRT